MHKNSIVPHIAFHLVTRAFLQLDLILLSGLQDEWLCNKACYYILIYCSEKQYVMKQLNFEFRASFVKVRIVSDLKVI